MIRGTYSSTSGMVAMLARVEQISNNLANIETTGFKEDTLRMSAFPQLLMRRMGNGSAPGGNGGPTIGSTGTGVAAESSVVRYTQGSLRPTESPLDVALDGAGFFAVQTPQGVRYTRDGGFRRDAANQLVTAQGDRVLNPAGQPITLPGGETTVRADGQLRVNGAPAGQIGVFAFGDPGQLLKTQNNLFQAPAGAAAGAAPAATTVQQGYLEGSNVDPTRAMADLMMAQRAYEASARLVQIQDEMTGRAANDVGRL